MKLRGNAGAVGKRRGYGETPGAMGEIGALRKHRGYGKHRGPRVTTGTMGKRRGLWGNTGTCLIREELQQEEEDAA